MGFRKVRVLVIFVQEVRVELFQPLRVAYFLILSEDACLVVILLVEEELCCPFGERGTCAYVLVDLLKHSSLQLLADLLVVQIFCVLVKLALSERDHMRIDRVVFVSDLIGLFEQGVLLKNLH